MYTCFICAKERMFAGSPTKHGWTAHYDEKTQTWEYICKDCAESAVDNIQSYGAS